MSTHALRPWTDLVKLHPDVEAGALTEAVFAIDLGAIAAGDPNVPVVNRDPEAFFRATYLTADLRRLLDEVLACLTGKSGYNRVLKLRTPFGGGAVVCRGGEELHRRAGAGGREADHYP